MLYKPQKKVLSYKHDLERYHSTKKSAPSQSKKRVKCLDTGQEFSSVAECSEFFKIPKSTLSRMLRGGQSPYKHTFDYV